MKRAIAILLVTISISVISCNIPSNELKKLIPEEGDIKTTDTLYLVTDTTLFLNGKEIDFHALDDELMQLDTSFVVLKTNSSVTVGSTVEVMNALNRNNITVKVTLE